MATDSCPFSVLSYFLNPHFQFKAGCCIYVRNDITCSHAHNLESSQFSTIWLRLQSHSLTKFICAVYLSTNSSDYVKFFDYLASKVDCILSHFPYAEDFNVHHQLWLSSSFTDQPGEQTFNCATLHDQSSWCSSLPVSVTFSLFCQTFLSVGLLQSQTYFCYLFYCSSAASGPT